VVHDHLALPDLTGFNPLLGPPTSPDYLRFLPVSDAYSPTLRRSVFLAAHKLGLPWEDLAEGTYAWVSGPTYETPAEGRFLRAAGADVVGMSTVPEVLAAREEGMDVCVLSLVTNAVVIPETYWSIRDEVEAEVRQLYQRTYQNTHHILTARGQADQSSSRGGRFSRGGVGGWPSQGGSHAPARRGGGHDAVKMLAWMTFNSV
jgi:purine nucleoside phosphorylase